MAIDKSRLSIPHILKTLWLNWMISYGAITLPLLLGIFTPKLWLPFICLAEVYLLSAYSHNREHGRLGADSLPIEMTIKALTLAAAAMFVVVILCTDWLVPTVIHLKLYNSEIPFVTCLVMFPIVAGLCAATVYMGLGAHRTRESQRRTGFYAGDSVMATLYYNESKYQVKLLMMLALLLGGVEYWYYFARYINSDMNAPDRFFFNYMPIVMFLLSAAVMWGRYENLSNLLNTMHSKRPDTDFAHQFSRRPSGPNPLRREDRHQRLRPQILLCQRRLRQRRERTPLRRVRPLSGARPRGPGSAVVQRIHD